MMMKYSRDEEILTKQEGDDAKTTTNNNNLQGGKYYKGAGASSSSSRQWSAGLKNPRIVRVSRTFGGKDRHSKVCTIRGLRDRRIRLSVPTAIQLYDLQDRLGLSQPSKVIDWLLDATKTDIDKLPPLQIPPGSFGFHHHQQQHPMAPFDHVANHHTGAFQSSFGAGPFFDADLTLMNDIATGASNPLYNSSAKQGININHGVDINVEEQEEEDEEEEEEEEDNQLSLEARLEKISRNINRSNKEKHHHHDQYHGAAGGHNTYGSSTPQQQRQRQQQQQEEAAAAALAQNLFPMSNGLSSNITPMAPYGDYHDHWEPPSNLSLYHFGSLNHLPSADPQTDHQDQTSSSTSAVPLPSSQLFFCPQANMASTSSTSSLFPPQYSSYNINTQVDRE